jgi:hypothetical protein
MNLEEFAVEFEAVLADTLKMLSVRLCVDHIRALHFGYDTFNGSLELSLLTDREALENDGKDEPHGDWIVGDWRYYNATETLKSAWPDAQHLIDWMMNHARALDQDAFSRFDDAIAAIIKTVVLGEIVQRVIREKFVLAEDFETRVLACND